MKARLPHLDRARHVVEVLAKRKITITPRNDLLIWDWLQVLLPYDRVPGIRSRQLNSRDIEPFILQQWNPFPPRRSICPSSVHKYHVCLRYHICLKSFPGQDALACTRRLTQLPHRLFVNLQAGCRYVLFEVFDAGSSWDGQNDSGS